jgi:CheY-like chemotaxis protein
MGSQITVHSQLGHGSSFEFDLPVELAEIKDVQTKLANRGKVIGLAPNHPQYRILVADDEPTNRLLLLRLFGNLNLDVREAKNGEEAIAQWQDWQPHLIWMDMQMPVIDGYQATEKIRSFELELSSSKLDQASPPSRTVIIALTASAFEEQRQRTLAAGCDDFVRKPFQKEEVLEKMATYLGLHYLYEKGAPSPDRYAGNTSSSGNQATCDSRAIASSLMCLATMPSEWLTTLYQAASQGNDRLVMELIEQIPATQPDLAHTLTHLVQNFRFDQLLSLTQTVKGKDYA